MPTKQSASSNQVEEYLTTAEAAELMKRKRATLYKWRSKGTKGPTAYGEGKDTYYIRSEVVAWMTRRSKRQTADSIASN